MSSIGRLGVVHLLKFTRRDMRWGGKEGGKNMWPEGLSSLTSLETRQLEMCAAGRESLFK